MNETIRILLERRSIRKFKPEQIKQEELNAILEAGMYAPSGGNQQAVMPGDKLNQLAVSQRNLLENEYLIQNGVAE
jgi:nitroreductase